MRYDYDRSGGRAATVEGRLIAHDKSGQGHCWCLIPEDDLPGSIIEELEAEIRYRGRGGCESYTASNGQHYRW